jgi:hypothetical protein
MGTKEFQGFPKISRYSREVIVSEKIDGTNAQLFIDEEGTFLVGSRTRWITPQKDNYGFAKWAYEHKEELLTLGPGRHFGEWWGQGIQRNYRLKEKRFSLFNTQRWCLHNEIPKHIITTDLTIEKYQDILPICCGTVPVIKICNFDILNVFDIMRNLQENGSMASPGFMKPEGIVIFHVAGNVGFKKTFEKDNTGKNNF